MSQVDRDIEQIKHLFPDRVETRYLGKSETTGPFEIVIDGVGFCAPYLGSVHAGLLLAKAVNANCLFDRRVLHYLRCKFGITAFPDEADVGRIQSFMTVFDAYFPNEPLLTNYAFHSLPVRSRRKVQ